MILDTSELYFSLDPSVDEGGDEEGGKGGGDEVFDFFYGD